MFLLRLPNFWEYLLKPVICFLTEVNFGLDSDDDLDEDIGRSPARDHLSQASVTPSTATTNPEKESELK